MDSDKPQEIVPTAYDDAHLDLAIRAMQYGRTPYEQLVSEAESRGYRVVSPDPDKQPTIIAEATGVLAEAAVRGMVAVWDFTDKAKTMFGKPDSKTRPGRGEPHLRPVPGEAAAPPDHKSSWVLPAAAVATYGVVRAVRGRSRG